MSKKHSTIILVYIFIGCLSVIAFTAFSIKENVLPQSYNEAVSLDKEKRQINCHALFSIAAKDKRALEYAIAFKMSLAGLSNKHNFSQCTVYIEDFTRQNCSQYSKQLLSLVEKENGTQVSVPKKIERLKFLCTGRMSQTLKQLSDTIHFSQGRRSTLTLPKYNTTIILDRVEFVSNVLPGSFGNYYLINIHAGKTFTIIFDNANIAQQFRDVIMQSIQV
ncbi:MAG: hypothetical protein QM500_12450 [Methylococcales bacterium]